VILWGFDGFFGLWSISDAQCAGAPWDKNHSHAFRRMAKDLSGCLMHLLHQQACNWGIT
jgi:hypothetical protein